MTNRKRLLAAALFLTLTIAGFFVRHLMTAEDDPLRVGYIGSISGKYAAMGASGRNGALLAAEEINAGGGIGGRLLELVIMDDAGDPAASLAAAKILEERGLALIVGPFTTACATRILPYINEKRLLTVGPSNAGENLAGSDDYFIKLFPSTKTVGEKIAALAVRQNVSTMAVITDHRNRRFGETMIAGFSPVYARGGMTLLAPIAFYSDRGTRYAELARRAAMKRPEGVFIISSPLDTAMLAQKVRALLPSARLYTAPWAISRELIENGGEAVEGMQFYVPYIANDTSPVYRSYHRRFTERFGEEPTHVSIFNYEAIRLVAGGLSAAPAHTPDALKAALLSMGSFEGLQSHFTLDANGDAQRPLYLHEIRNRTFTPIPDDA